MAEFATVLKDLASKIAKALGHDASGAEKRLMHDTGDNLEQNVRAHVEHDERAAQNLRRAAGDDHTVLTTHGGGSAAPRSGSGAGPAAAPPDPIHGGGAGAPSTTTPQGAGHAVESVPQLHGGAEPGLGLPGEQRLDNPGSPVTTDDYPYLRPSSTDRESQALPGAPATSPGVARTRPDGHPPIDDGALSTFTGDVQPDYMRAGVTYARSVGDGSYPNGSFWTRHVVSGDDELRSDLAVKNTWNGDHGVVTFTPNHDIPVWSGAAGPQYATGGGDYHLPGGGEQIWVPDGRDPHYSIGADDGDWTIAPQPGTEQS